MLMLHNSGRKGVFRIFHSDPPPRPRVILWEEKPNHHRLFSFGEYCDLISCSFWWIFLSEFTLWDLSMLSIYCISMFIWDKSSRLSLSLANYCKHIVDRPLPVITRKSLWSVKCTTTKNQWFFFVKGKEIICL